VTPLPDQEHCYAAVQSRDPRFDGWFVTAVTSTKIYCRPSCPAVTPKRSNVRFYATSAAAQQAGFRACLRCRPDAAPGSPEWNLRADLVGRAMRLIADGLVDREGVTGLARRLGYTERHLHRQLVAEVGAGPLALARAQRAQTARILVETTAMPFGDVAFAAGFASIRQFNDTVRAVFGTTPTGLRSGRRASGTAATNGSGPGAVSLRLPVRPPFDAPGLLGFLSLRAVPGVEESDGTTYRRVLRLPRGLATVSLTAAGDPTAVACTLRLTDLRDLAAAVERCRRLLDADADPVAVDAALAGDPTLAPLVRATPGRRVPGTVDGGEIAVRAVLGQQVSVAAARTAAARLTAEHGERLAEPDGALTTAFPTSAALAALAPETLPMPRSRGRSLVALTTALADGDLVLDPGADRAEAEVALRALPGIGPWTASYIGLRALADPDAFLPTDLGVRRGADALELPSEPAPLAAHAERWRPWRAYAAVHLWTADTRSTGDE
jgi:AraC family transcriptional regulator of adaptative response / DNA-3-methyladenine glycosylase II